MLFHPFGAIAAEIVSIDLDGAIEAVFLVKTGAIPPLFGAIEGSCGAIQLISGVIAYDCGAILWCGRGSGPGGTPRNARI